MAVLFVEDRAPPQPPQTIDPWARAGESVVGRLQARWTAWRDRVRAPEAVVQWLREGVRLVAVEKVGELKERNRVGRGEEERWVQQEIWRLWRLGALEPCGKEDVDAVSPLHLVPKPGMKKYRLVVDQRAVNSSQPRMPFKFEGLGTFLAMVEPEDFLVSWDLAEGYMHVLVEERSRRLMGVIWKGKVFRFVTLTFGLSVSPWYFCKTMRVLLCHWREKGCRVANHVDDFILAAKTKEEARKKRDACADDMTELGLVREVSKGDWEPTQRLKHLGLIIDTLRRVVEVPQDKLEHAAEVITKILEANQAGGAITARWLASLAGSLISVERAFGPARLMTRAMYGVIGARDRKPWEWNQRVQLTGQVVQDLQWLQQNLHAHNGRLAWRPPVVRVMEVDASTSVGCGGRLLGLGRDPERRFGLSWSAELKREWGLEHINIMELAAVLMGLLSFGGLLHDSNLEVRLDSAVAKAYLERSGGRGADKHYTEMMRILRRIMEVAWKGNINLLAPVWIPGSENEAADFESRMVDWHDWFVKRGCFQRINRLWGPHTCDRFADSNNSQLPVFNSWRWCPNTSGVDTFTQEWDGLSWVVAPVALMHKVLKTVIFWRARATVVVPLWPGQPWWPVLCELEVRRVELGARDFGAGPSGHVEPFKNEGWSYAAVLVDGARKR
jgi:hypothetical protein